MALRISASDFATSCWLQVEADGVVYCEATIASSKRRFRFADILSVLLSPENVLSFQVGDEIFSIRMKPTNRKHQQVLEAFLAGMRSVGGVPPPPRL